MEGRCDLRKKYSTATRLAVKCSKESFSGGGLAHACGIGNYLLHSQRLSVWMRPKSSKQLKSPVTQFRMSKCHVSLKGPLSWHRWRGCLLRAKLPTLTCRGLYSACRQGQVCTESTPQACPSRSGKNTESRDRWFKHSTAWHSHRGFGVTAKVYASEESDHVAFPNAHGGDANRPSLDPQSMQNNGLLGCF